MVRHTNKKAWAAGRHPVIAHLALAAAWSAEALIDIAKGLRPREAVQDREQMRYSGQPHRSRLLLTIADLTKDEDRPPRDTGTAEYTVRVWLRSAILFQSTPDHLLRVAKTTGNLAAIERVLFVDENSLEDSWLRRRLAHIRRQGPTALTARMTNALAGRMTLPKPRVVLARIAAFAIAASVEASRLDTRAGKPLTHGDMHGVFLAALRDEPSTTVDSALPANDDGWRKAVEREQPAIRPLALASLSYFRRTKLAL